jgi:hypothetical protein
LNGRNAYEDRGKTAGGGKSNRCAAQKQEYFSAMKTGGCSDAVLNKNLRLQNKSDSLRVVHLLLKT